MILRECGCYRLACVPDGRTGWLQANVLTTRPPAQERKVGSVRPLPLLDVLLAILAQLRQSYWEVSRKHLISRGETDGIPGFSEYVVPFQALFSA